MPDSGFSIFAGTMSAPSNNPSPITELSVSRLAEPEGIHEAKVSADKQSAFLQEIMPAVDQAKSHEVAQALAEKARCLYAETRWAPSAVQLQRGRAHLMGAFRQPTNLPLHTFAKLAGKSRQQVLEDIDARSLLALNVASCGIRIPGWQLDDVKLLLTQMVLFNAKGVDDWTIYYALSAPLEGLGGSSPIEAVTATSIRHTAVAALNATGLQIQRCSD